MNIDHTRPQLRLAALLATACIAAFAALPTAAAITVPFDCPPHPLHCPFVIGPIYVGNNTIEGEIAVVVSNLSFDEAPVNVLAGAKVTIRVTLTVTGAADVGVTANVTLGPVPGVTPSGPAFQTAAPTTAAPAVVDFPVALDAEMPVGDHLFIPVDLHTGGGTARGYAVLQVVEDVGEASVLTTLLENPLSTGVAGLLVGGTTAWAVFRTRNGGPPEA